MQIKDININSLKDIATEMSSIQCNFWAENCAIALQELQKQQGELLIVNGDISLQFRLFWTIPESTNGYKEPRDWLKYGAVAISCFLVREITEYSVIEESPQGTGFDYWLGYDESSPNFDPDNFYQARLEISGIAKESKSNTINSRSLKKKKQTKRSDHLGIPAFVSVIEFKTPKAYFAKTA